MGIFARLRVGFTGMEVLYSHLVNASYMIMFRSFFCIKDRRWQNTGMGAGKTDIWRGDLGCFLLVFRVERARRLYVS